MEKIAEKFYKVDEQLTPSSGVELRYKIDLIDGEYLDTAVTLEGNFTIAGSQRTEFAEKLGALIDKYRI